MTVGLFARRKDWTGGDMTPAGANEEFKNLRLVLENLNRGVSVWQFVTAETIRANTFLSGKGSATNDDAAAGDIGETVVATFGNSNTGATGVWTNITSISLTAGSWLVTGQFQFGLNGATATECSGAISINSGNTTTDQVSGDNQLRGLVPTGSQDSCITIASYKLKLAATTTVYIKQEWTFSAGTPRQEGGKIFAVRFR